MIEVNNERFVTARTVSKGNYYRFDLSPHSIVVLCKEYDFAKGWLFVDENFENPVWYTYDEISKKLKLGYIWKKV